MKISVIGAGAMGGATVEGLIKGHLFSNDDITVSDPSQAVVDKFAKLGVNVTTDNQQAAKTADIVCNCRRRSFSKHQGMVGCKLSPTLPDYSKHRHCPVGFDDLHRTLRYHPTAD